MSLPSQLREQIAITAKALGPDAPTLCSPWTVRDLLAHLIVRESRPDVMPGIGLPVPALRQHTAKVQDSVAAGEFVELIGRVRQGPAPYWPTQLPALDRMINTGELAIHLEDMVRAQPGWTPSELPQGAEEQLWAVLKQAGKMLYRSAPVGVVAVAEGGPVGRVALRRPPQGRGTVVLRGRPLELLLHAFGRTGVAQVSIEGAPEDVAALAAHSRGV